MSDDGRKVPTGRLGRVLRFGLGGAKAGAKMLIGGGQDLAAKQATELLGNMRGLAAKLGQIASYVDGFIPEEHREAYEKALGTLRAQAPKSPYPEVRALIVAELGASPEELFATFEPEPFASASIGQVHRATLSDGKKVAVKVQHPGIDRAVRADLDNAKMIEAVVGGMGARKVGSREAVEEVRARFLEELDYTLEAERQGQFAKLFEGDAQIHIPMVVLERSARRVMTSEFIEGRTLDEIAKDPEDARREYAETMWRFVFTGNLIGRMFNADPHPGNYLFQESGKVTFLDFGCVQPLSGAHFDHARKLHTAAVARDEAGFRDAARSLLGTRAGKYEDWAIDFSRRCFQPIFESPFHITRAYNTMLVERMREMKSTVLFDKSSGVTPLPPGMLFINRLQFGFYSVLARLDVAVDYAEVERRILRIEPRAIE